jgi:divalent metal cation (Fe/Co/Zn/Cd) transporter
MARRRDEAAVPEASVGAGAVDRPVALRRAVRLESLTVIWMSLEAILAVGAGIAARSVLLTAFGTDSVIELLSGATLLWRLQREALGKDPANVEALEERATWISAVLLLLLCVYVVLSSIVGLVLRIEPESTWLGLIVAAAAVVVMPWLARQKRNVNVTLQSPALRADVVESATCAYLAGITLAGVGIHALTGWWWVEYLAAIGLLGWLIPETREAFEAALGRRHGDPHH